MEAKKEILKMKSDAEVIGFHKGWDIQEVRDGRYQRYTNPKVFVCGSDYYCAPAVGQKPPKDFKWTQVGSYYGRTVFQSKPEDNVDD